MITWMQLLAVWMDRKGCISEILHGKNGQDSSISSMWQPLKGHAKAAVTEVELV